MRYVVETLGADGRVLCSAACEDETVAKLLTLISPATPGHAGTRVVGPGIPARLGRGELGPVTPDASGVEALLAVAYATLCAITGQEPDPAMGVTVTRLEAAADAFQA